ncbi:MAG: hypothetical protein U9Q06_00125 [Nanoarchaeota archaeon]|nr:hypothetical protein [Nanoarchaeota archaeon]
MKDETFFPKRDKMPCPRTQFTGVTVKPLEGKGYKNIKMDEKYSSPVTFSCYGNKVAIFFWSEIPMIVRVENKDIAKSFQNHFNLLLNLSREIRPL